MTVVQNAASAAQQGCRVQFRVAGGRRAGRISGSATFLDAYLTRSFCGTTTLVFPTSCPNQQSGSGSSPISFADGTVVQGPYAPSGTRLPGTPRLKLNLLSRYGFSITGDWTGYGQAEVVYQDASVPLCSRRSTSRDPRGSSIWASCRLIPWSISPPGSSETACMSTCA